MHGILFLQLSRKTEITTSRRGDVTNARDKQTVHCPLLISNYGTGGWAVDVIAGTLDFTVCYNLAKVHFNSADCLNT